ncbi:tetratricopeptide (TPR) repeat protein [Flavobacterium sp. CG_9.10]|uniref:tetratricopeptide repeat protein n=1 Tax=Flavobacterium sp. CG_9.10 TaxID=2787729 RepID=UPI0018CBE7D4|nr:tetratricopeptide repeat protein [Flavobacterium sp. CG_9.10]MBG6112132.1 tetratricopeptide (TPR) repeat protein [Flavobacterium sp. CG_9.10]
MKIIILILTFYSFTNCYSQTYHIPLYEGREKYDSGDYRGAIASYTKFIKDYGPSDYEVYWRRGDAKSKLRDYLGALLDYNRFLSSNGYTLDTTVYYRRGIVKNKLGDFKGAIADYIESIRLFPYVETDFINKGTEKFTFEVYNGAIAYYTNQISLNPDNGFIYKCRGIVKLESGDKISACLDFYKGRDLEDPGASSFISKYCN